MQGHGKQRQIYKLQSNERFNVEKSMRTQCENYNRYDAKVQKRNSEEKKEIEALRQRLELIEEFSEDRMQNESEIEGFLTKSMLCLSKKEQQQQQQQQPKKHHQHHYRPRQSQIFSRYHTPFSILKLKASKLSQSKPIEVLSEQERKRHSVQCQIYLDPEENAYENDKSIVAEKTDEKIVNQIIHLPVKNQPKNFYSAKQIMMKNYTSRAKDDGTMIKKKNQVEKKEFVKAPVITFDDLENFPTTIVADHDKRQTNSHPRGRSEPEVVTDYKDLCGWERNSCTPETFHRPDNHHKQKKENKSMSSLDMMHLDTVADINAIEEIKGSRNSKKITQKEFMCYKRNDQEVQQLKGLKKVQQSKQNNFFHRLSNTRGKGSNDSVSQVRKSTKMKDKDKRNTRKSMLDNGQIEFNPKFRKLRLRLPTLPLQET